MKKVFVRIKKFFEKSFLFSLHNNVSFLFIILFSAIILTGCLDFNTSMDSEILGIKIVKQPNKTTYIKGESFDLTGLIVYVVYKDGREEPYTDFTSSLAQGDIINFTGQKEVVLTKVIQKPRRKNIFVAKFYIYSEDELIKDAMRFFTNDSEEKEWSIYNYVDLEKLAEVVNSGRNLKGVTINQRNNILINKSVLGKNFTEPTEVVAGEPNPSLINFAGIGSREHPFAGTYNGNKKTISGLYIYGGQKGLGFFGALEGATIKNVIILDACVVNRNTQKNSDGDGDSWWQHDGTDDDRFGGLVGFIESYNSKISNCIFVGTVGSQAALDRGGYYEYLGGIVGRADVSVTLTNCFSIVKLYGQSCAAALVGKDRGEVIYKDCYGVSLDGKVYRTNEADSLALDEKGGVSRSEIIIAARNACGIDLSEYFEKVVEPVSVSPVSYSLLAGEVTEGETVALSAGENTVIYYELVKPDETPILTKQNYESATKYTGPISLTEDVTIYAIAVRNYRTSDITRVTYTVIPRTAPIPNDSIQKWTKEAMVTEYSVYNFADLEKLAEIVNAGNDLAGITITQKNDIKINERVLGEKFEEPKEAAVGVANSDLINFTGIGSHNIPFAGTYDGNGKIISGLYIYGAQQGLGFFGCLKGATVKNVIILDACVVNNNASGEVDATDDDRFGGIVGSTYTGEYINTVENCIFIGTVGSKDANDRGGAYEYNAGIIGRIERYSTANLINCFSLVKLYGSAAPLVKKVAGTVNINNCYGVSLDGRVYKTNVVEDIYLNSLGGVSSSEIISAARMACGFDLTEYFKKAGFYAGNYKYDVEDPVINITEMKPSIGFLNGKNNVINKVVTVNGTLSDDSGIIDRASWKLIYLNEDNEYIVINEGNILSTIFSFEVDTEVCDIDKKDAYLVVTAYDRAGNDSELWTPVFLDQETDLPTIEPYAPDSLSFEIKVKEELLDLLNNSGKEEIKNFYSGASQMMMKFSDDDGIYSINVYVSPIGEDNPYQNSVQLSGITEYVYAFTVPEAEGYYIIKVDVTDIHGTYKTESFCILVSCSIPSIQLIAIPEFVTTNTDDIAPDAKTSFTIIGNNVGVAPFRDVYRVFNDNSEGEELARNQYTESGEGKNDAYDRKRWVDIFTPETSAATGSVKYTVCDAYGISASEIFNYKVDSIRPTATITSCLDENTSSSGTFRFIGTAEDNENGSGLTGIQIRIDNYDEENCDELAKEWGDFAYIGNNTTGWIDASGTDNWNCLIDFNDYPSIFGTEGKKVLYVRVTDGVGNYNELTDLTRKVFVYDTSAPQVSIQRYINEYYDESVSIVGENSFNINQLFSLEGTVSDDYGIRNITVKQTQGTGNNAVTVTVYNESSYYDTEWIVEGLPRKSDSPYESQDDFVYGPYKYTVTVTDNAGKESIKTVDIIFNQNIPDNIPNMNPLTSNVTMLPVGTDGTAGTDATYVLFGDWPQTIKADNVIVYNGIREEHGAFTYYCGSDGYWYVKCKENACENYSELKYSNGIIVSKANENRVKYFKVEPIKWRVLSDNYKGTGNALLLAENILTSNIEYCEDDQESRIIDGTIVYSNNYKESKIRAFLNGLSYLKQSSSGTSLEIDNSFLNRGFLQTAFNTNAQNLITITNVDNSAAETTDSGNNLRRATDYICDNTNDKLFLLSENEVTKGIYGFVSCYSYGLGNTRIRITTDYAKATYAFQNDTIGYGGWWWLRSPCYLYTNGVRYVYFHGSATEVTSSNNKSGGIVPALTISLSPESGEDNSTSQIDDGFVFIQGGTVVGSDDYNQYETGVFPAGRTVILSNFYMSDHEVTQGEYTVVMGENPSGFSSNPASGEIQANRPVENVSWYDAIYFCNKKSIAEGLTPCYSVEGNTEPTKWNYIPHNGNDINGTISCDFNANGYRLPTEAEWEFAARGGMETYGKAAFSNYFAGASTTDCSAYINSDLDSVGWYVYNICNNGVTSSSEPNSSESGFGTHEVKKKLPNALGLYDMSGNVWEWSWDWYDSIDSGTVSDPCGVSSGSVRIRRGGGWGDDAICSSVSFRIYYDPYYRYSSGGFRLVRSAR